MTDWFISKVNQLDEVSNVIEKKEILALIKVKLLSLSRDELKALSVNLEFVQLFSQLTSQDREYLNDLCNVLRILMASQEPGHFYQTYPNEISQLVSHPEIPVRILMLEELIRTVSSTKLSLLLKNSDLLAIIIDKVADSELSIARNSMLILKKIAKTPEGLQIIYSGNQLRNFARLISKNDTVSFRVYDIVTNISINSSAGLEASIKLGFLQSLIAILDCDDELLYLNALDALSNLTQTQEGLNYLQEQGVLKKLADKISLANENNPLSNLLIPGLMKFFGHVAKLWPNQIFSEYPTVVSALFDVIEYDNQTLLPTAVDTLGHVASSVQGKYALQSLGESMPKALRRIGELVKNMPTDLRLRCLNVIVCILNVKLEEQDNRILSLTKYWFDCLWDEPLKFLVGICRQPFADIRQAGLELLAVIGSQTWGQEYIAVFPGLIEFLLDRNVESFKECKEAKYRVVVALSMAVANIFDANTLQKIRLFIEQGPFFVETNVEIATENV